MYPCFTAYEAGTSIDWDGDTKVFFNFDNKKFLFFFGYPAILALGAMKKQTLLPSLFLICLVSRLVYPKQHIHVYILSTWQNDRNGVVTNKLYSVKPVQGDWQSSYSAGRTKKSCHACISHTHLTHSYILR